jgi:hypothetical protein
MGEEAIAVGDHERRAVASMCCAACGKVLAADDVPLSRILDFVAGAEAAGWRFNAKGFVCCPECAAGSP